MEPLDPLDDGARGLLAAYREQRPGPGARARNGAAVQQRIASAPMPTRRSPLWIGAVAFAMAAAILLVVRAVFGVWQAAQLGHAVPETAVDRIESPSSEVIVEPRAPTPALVPVAPPSPPLAEPEVAPVTVQRPQPAKPSVREPSRAGDEVELIAAARYAIGKQSWSQALERLDDHAQRFPRGVLAEERAALRVLVLCRTHAEGADEAVRSFGSSYPGSHHHRSIALACSSAENRTTP